MIEARDPSQPPAREWLDDCTREKILTDHPFLVYSSRGSKESVTHRSALRAYEDFHAEVPKTTNIYCHSVWNHCALTVMLKHSHTHKYISKRKFSKADIIRSNCCCITNASEPSPATMNCKSYVERLICCSDAVIKSKAFHFVADFTTMSYHKNISVTGSWFKIWGENWEDGLQFRHLLCNLHWGSTWVSWLLNTYEF